MLEKQLLQRLDALQEMMGGEAKTQPQGEGEVPETVQPACVWILEDVMYVCWMNHLYTADSVHACTIFTCTDVLVDAL